jgi:hypothetical protein
MKEVLSAFTFGIGALCFVVFVTVFKPTAVSAVHGTGKPVYCSTDVSPAHGCRLPAGRVAEALDYFTA